MGVSGQARDYIEKPKVFCRVFSFSELLIMGFCFVWFLFEGRWVFGLGAWI